MTTTDRRQSRAIVLAFLGLFSSGCISSSSAGDVARVRELSRSEGLPPLPADEVDPALASGADRLLSKPLDVEAAVRLALLGNRELRATLRDMGVVRGRVLQASLLPNPHLEAALPPEPETELELGVEYDVTGAIFAPLRARALAPELEAARYRASAAVVDLGYRVRTAFYGLQAAEQRLRIAERVQDGALASKEARDALLAAGNTRELDAASEEVAYEKVRITVAELELAAAAAREELRRLLGVHGKDAEFRIDPELRAVPGEARAFSQTETHALRASLELAEVRHRLESLARRAGLTRTEGWTPDVTLGVTAARLRDHASGDREWDLGAGVQVGVPLFDRGQGTATGLEAEFDALLERYHGVAVDIRSAAREAQNRVASAHGRARKYQDVILPGHRRILEQTLLHYNAMQVSVFQLLEARRGLLAAELIQVETSREYWSAVAGLETLLRGGRAGSTSPPVAGSMPNETEPAGGH